MKILHIIDSGGLYGAEMVLLNLVAEQIKMGLDPTIASISEKHISEKPLETEALKRGFKVRKFRMRPGPNFLGALKILQFAHQKGFDLMHSHGYKGNILFGFLPKNVRKLPFVATLHGWTSTDGLKKMKLYEWLDAKSLRFIDAVILVSHAMKSHHKLKNLNGIKLHVVNNGIPLLDFHAPSQPHNIATSGPPSIDQSIVDFCNKTFTIGSIGRLSTEKGYTYLIEALALLIKEGIDARLVIIGEGYDRSFLEKLVEQFVLIDRVSMPGYRAHARNYIPFFDVFVISSFTEGLPVTLLEAMQARTPIVATKAGGIPRVLKNCQEGLLVETCSSESLAQAIHNVYLDPSLANKLIMFAYQKATTEYTSAKMALQYLQIYKTITSA